MGKKKERFYDNGLKFACTGCGGCCKLDGGKVFLTGQEVETMSEFLDISTDSFIEQYVKNKEYEKYLLKDGQNDNCIFLEDERCKVYPVRPIQCKTFPFWPENMKSLYRWKIIAEECPGIGQGHLFIAAEITEVLNNRQTVEILIDRNDDQEL